jgi:Single Cache domain 2
MVRSFVIAAISAAALAISTAAIAADFGTADEAKAMLEKVVAAMKADAPKTIAQINKGEGGFKDRDLYPVCSLDGKIVANPDASRIGMMRKDIKDATGKAFGAEMETVAEEGKFAEVSYMFPRPGADKTPVAKVSYVTKAAGYVCIVGYYK